MRKQMLAMVTAVALFILASIACEAAGGADVSAMWWGKNPLRKPAAMGTVQMVSATSLAVETRKGPVTFAVTEKTVVFVLGKKAGIGDVKAGDPVVVRFEGARNAAPVALGVVVPRPSVKGVITALVNDTITIKNKQGTVTILVTPDTVYRSERYVGTAANLRVGYAVNAACVEENGAKTAVRVGFMPSVAKGAVVAINGNVITVKTLRQKEISVLAGPATVVTIRPRIGPNKKGRTADVQIGSPVNIGFHRVPDGPAPLLWIDVLTGM